MASANLIKVLMTLVTVIVLSKLFWTEILEESEASHNYSDHGPPKSLVQNCRDPIKEAVDLTKSIKEMIAQLIEDRPLEVRRRLWNSMSATDAEFTAVAQMAFHEKGAGQLSRQTGPNVEDLASEFAKHTCSEDRMRIRDIANVNLEKTGRPPGELKNIFYKNIMQLVQNVCEQKKVLGHGQWGTGNFFEGQAAVCLDDIISSQIEGSQPCIAYLFSKEQEVSLQDSLLEYGCEVVPYQILTDGPQSNSQGGKFSISLAKELLKNQHHESSITFLKFDVSEEQELFQRWIDSNALAKVQQLSLQFHNVERDLVLSFRVVKRLYSRGFRIIHYEPNYHFPFKTGLADVFTLLLKKGSRCD